MNFPETVRTNAARREVLRGLLEPRTSRTPKVELEPDKERFHRALAKKCGCGRRWLPAEYHYCFLCERKDRVFAVLDALIAEGIDIPREKLGL